MINLVYTVIDSQNAANNKAFYNDYLAAFKYLQKLHSVLFTKYLAYTSDYHEEKFMYSNEGNSWKTVRTIELDTTAEAKN